VNEVHELKAIRGAITVEADEPEQVIAAARELTQELLAQNGLAPDDIVSAIFTATADLVSAFPAVGAREAGLVNTALLCAQEIPVPGSQPRCIRALVHAYVKAGQPVRHVYLREAAALRPDWAGAASGGSASGKPSAAGA